MRSRFRGQELKDDNLFGFVLSTSIPRFKFLHVCSTFPILVSIFERLVLSAKEKHIELFLNDLKELIIKCLHMKTT